MSPVYPTPRMTAAEAAAQLAAIVESSYDAIISRTLDRKILSWNKAAERMFGYTAAEMIGQSAAAIIPPDLEDETAHYRTLVNAGVSVAHDSMRLSKDGRRIEVSVRQSPIRDETGDIIGVSVIFRDVGERKRAEAAVREGERRLATLIDNLPGMVYRCLNDPQWTMEFMSAGCSALTGYAPEDFTGGRLAYAELIVPDDRERARETVRRAIAGGMRFTMEYRIQRADGETRWVWEQGCGITGPDGRLLVREGFIRDITESRQAEYVLQKKAQVTELMETMARAVNEAATPAVAMRACLEQIHRYGGWTIGRIVTFGTASRRMVAESLLWHGSDDPALAAFKRASEGFDYTNRKGRFVSAVLHEQRPVWLADIAGAGGRGRLLEAIAAELCSAFAFPVIVRGEVAAMLEFFSRERREVDALLLQHITTIASQLARVVERDRSEAALAQLAAIVESSNDAIISRTLDGIVISWNVAAGRMLGYTAAEAVGRHIKFVFTGRNPGKLDSNTQRLLSGDVVAPYPAQRRAKDGRLIDVLVSVSPLKDRVGNMVGVATILQDISALKRAELALKETEQQFRQLATHIPEVFWVMDVAEQAMIYVSPAYGRVWGRAWDGSAISLDRWMASVHAEDRKRIAAALCAIADEGYGEEYRILHPDGSVCWVHDRAFPVKDADGRTYRITGIAADITERREIEERLRQLAHFDQLTHLPNRVLFKDRLEQAIAHAKRSDERVAVLYVDLDGFKAVNDTYGHAVADELLAGVGSRLKACTRVTDTVARLGGDEFGIVLTDLATEESSHAVAQKIIAALGRPFYSGGKEVFVSGSVGLALFPSDGTQAETLTRNADTAMYKAKQLGRNAYQHYSREMDDSVQRRLALERHLRRAVEEGAFELHYQPKIDLRTERVTGVEALLRWRHAERGQIPPADFVPLLEDLGLIARVTHWVLREACWQAQAWRAAGLGTVNVAVNVSARQLHREGFDQELLAIMRETGCDPGQLEIEITESFLMHDLEAASKLLENVRRAGVRLTLDDFGTGYSSLSYLSRFEIDAVKIDGTFICDAVDNRHHAAIARGVIALAHNLGMRAIAEGVETDTQLAFLRENGCDEMQGFYFSRPLAGEACGELLRARPTLASPRAKSRG